MLQISEIKVKDLQRHCEFVSLRF